MQPIIPFEAIRSEKFPVGENWSAQVKGDRVRILTYWDAKKVQLL